jgi:hypothetical protein
MLNNIQLSPHFSLLELTESATARQRDIANIPPPEAVENLKRLCKGTLEPLRKALGLPVIITSGYRCKELNNIVNRSSKTSQHMLGQAADFYISSEGSMRRELLIMGFRLIILNEDIDYDQLILYPTFIHVSYVSRSKNRRKIIKANGHGTYCTVTREAALCLS